MEQATFTDPSDQSAWIYHRWLLSQSLERYQDAQRCDAPQQDTAYQVGPPGRPYRLLCPGSSHAKVAAAGPGPGPEQGGSALWRRASRLCSRRAVIRYQGSQHIHMQAAPISCNIKFSAHRYPLVYIYCCCKECHSSPPLEVVMTAKLMAQMRIFSLAQELQAVLQREICRCESLLDAEDDRSKCKWPMLTMARLLELRKSLHARQGEWQRAACLHCCSLISTMSPPAHLWGS